MRKLLSYMPDIRRGEIGITALMGLNYFLILVTLFLLKPARDSLFLINVSSEQLPLVFILIALVTVPIVTLYSRASRRWSLNRLINITTGILIVSLLVLRWLIGQDHPWVYYLFYTWVSIFGLLTTSQFWLLANDIYDASQAKRIFVLLGLAGTAGAVTGGEVTGIVTKAVNTEDLLFVCMALMVISTILVGLIWSRRTTDVEPGAVRRTGEPQKDKLSRTLQLLYRSRHLSITVGIIAVMMMIGSIVDFQFKTIAEQSFDTEPALTAFLGKFYGRLNLVALVLQLFLSYRLIRTIGVVGVIMLLPACLALGTVAMLVAPGLMVAVLLRGTDLSLRNSLDKTGRELLFLPVPLEVKKRTKLFIDMFVDRWFRGLAGGLLLLFTMVFGMGLRGISLVVIALLAVWLVLVFMMRREYINSFRNAIIRRTIDLSELTVPINDTGTVNALIASLGSINERQVVYALEMLVSVRDVELMWPVRPLLVHASSVVRCKALQLLQSHGDSSLLGEVEKLLADEDPQVRREAVHFIHLHSPDDAEQKLKGFLHHREERIRLAAMAFVAMHGTGRERKLISHDLIESILTATGSEAQEGRQQLARILGTLDGSFGDAYLSRLLDDPSPPVVREAIGTIGQLRARLHVPWLVGKLGDRDYRAAARSALTAFGDSVLGTLQDYLDDTTTPMTVRCNIPRVLAGIPVQQSVDVLTISLENADIRLRYHIIKGLNRLRARYSDLRFDPRQLKKSLISETRHYYEILQMLHNRDDRDDNPAVRLLTKALEEKQQQNLERIFRLLGLVYPPRDVYNAYHRIVSGSKTLYANAVELLDNLLKSDLKKYILPILDDVSDELVLRRAQKLFDLGSGDWEEGLAGLITGRDRWLRCCAIYSTRGKMTERLRKLVAASSDDVDPMIAETARLVLAEDAG
ncbi:MAG: Npt1/Npt2 family nucleotide transporter [bacterium]